MAPLAPVTKKTASQLGGDEQAALRSYLHRGDAARELSGTKLINELGTAMLYQPNHEPKNANEVSQLESGNWSFFAGKQASSIDQVRASVVKLGGGKEPVQVAALPILLTDPKTKKSVQLPLFRVDSGEGKTLGFVDNLGRQYKTLGEWKNQNKLPAGELTYPANGHLTAGADGLPDTVTEPSHAVVDTTWEHAADWAEKIGTVAGFVVGGAALIGVGGIAIPIAGAALAIGFGGKAVMGLVDAELHGETINPVKSSEARANWLTAAASLAGLGSSGATMAAVHEVASAGQITGAVAKLAPGLTVGSQVLGTAQVADGGVSLVGHWNEMSWKDRMYATAQLAFFGATTGHAAKQAGGLKNLYSLEAVKTQLGFPVEATAVEKAPSLLSDRTTVRGNLAKKDFFGEVSQTGSNQVTSALANPKAIADLRAAGPDMLSGKTGRLQAARFINRDSRLDGDFRLAYGEQAYRAWASADAHLGAIPKGQLAEHLTLDLLREVNTKGYVAGEDSGLAKLGHALRAAQGNAVKGGALRDYQSRSLPFKMKPEEVHNIRANWAEVSAVHVGDVGQFALVYPDHTQIEPRLNALLAETRAGLADPNSDVIALGANFAQKFVSMHPFQDGNGRTARLVLDRILAERDVPPPIFKDTGNDVTLSTADYQAEVRSGVERMNQAVRTGGGASRLSPHAYMEGMVPGLSLPAPANNKLVVGGEAFIQGKDGFIYNSAGRPHTMSAEGELTPISQLEHYAIARRAHQAKDPNGMLGQFTETTRTSFAAATTAPEGQAKVTLGSELPAITADNQFVMNLGKSGNEGLVGLYDLKNTANLEGLLRHSNPASTTKAFAISKYNQIDLEMWHVQKALTTAGDSAGAAKLMQYREDLFGLAKEKLTSLKGPTPTESNPLGFAKKYEQLAYDESPLAFGSLKDAIKARGDDSIRVWRGDVVMSSTIGMHPDYSPMNADAFQLASLRGAKSGTASIVGDLAQVAGSSLGTGYLCYTTDLTLLNSANGFAEKFNPLSLELGALPKPIQEGLKKMLTVNEAESSSKTFSIDSLRDLVGIASGRKPAPKGKLDVSGIAPEAFEQIVRAQLPLEDATTLVTRYTEAYAKANGSPLARLQNMLSDAPVLVDVADVKGLEGYKGSSMLDSLAKARDVVQLQLDGDTLSVRTARRAFLVEMSKTDALAGIGTLGGRSFENEQEVTGLGKVAPWKILKAFKRSELDLDLPKPPPAGVSPTGP